MEFGDISTVNIKDDKVTRGAISAELTFANKPSAIAAINKYNTALVDGIMPFIYHIYLFL
jgi:hypothetical protein